MDLTNAQQQAWDKLGQRYEDVGFGELSKPEQHFVALEALAGDTLNGSLDQYFFNSSGDLALVAIEALDTLDERHYGRLGIQLSDRRGTRKSPKLRTRHFLIRKLTLLSHHTNAFWLDALKYWQIAMRENQFEGPLLAESRRSPGLG